MDSLCGQPFILFCIYVLCVCVCVCFVRTGPGPAARGAWKDSPRDLDERTTRHQYGHSEPQQILLTHNHKAGSQSDVTIKGEWKINRWRKKNPLDIMNIKHQLGGAVWTAAKRLWQIKLLLTVLPPKQTGQHELWWLSPPTQADTEVFERKANK